jgi:hypothetical protein
VCYYGQVNYKFHYVCTACRVSVKRFPDWASFEHPCPRCLRPMSAVGRDFAAPRRRDKAGWRAVEAVLAAGLRYEGRSACGCSREPKYRPRKASQARVRLRIAARTGVPVAQALAAPDPYDRVGPLL